MLEDPPPHGVRLHHPTMGPGDAVVQYDPVRRGLVEHEAQVQIGVRPQQVLVGPLLRHRDRAAEFGPQSRRVLDLDPPVADGALRYLRCVHGSRRGGLHLVEHDGPSVTPTGVRGSTTAPLGRSTRSQRRS